MFGYNIFLIGFMGTGKSTVADTFRKQYGMEIVEMDQAIVEKEGMSISDIFEKYGEEYFRNLETSLLKGMNGATDKIVSCGGGAVLRKENISFMKEQGKIVLLTASPEVIFCRVKNNKGRPLLQGKNTVEEIKAMMENRKKIYESAADIVICTDGKSLEIICKEIIEKL